MQLAKWLVLALLILLPVECFALAFPSAEGMGRNATGGRGGTVIKVTNLNDSGAGSFREAMTKNLSPDNGRIIVFDVSGNIMLTTMLYSDKNNVTIAGQTSPKGVSVGNKSVILYGSNIVIRHMRFRVGDQAYAAGNNDEGHSLLFPGPGYGATNDNIIMDHCTFTWGVDETLAFAGGVTNATLQKSIIAQGVRYGKGAGTEHSKGLLIANKPAGSSKPITMSLYRNYIAHSTDRQPLMDDEGTAGNVYIDAANNVIFNYFHGILPQSRYAKVNWRGNYLKSGPMSYDGATRPFVYSLTTMDYTNPTPQVYMSGNVGNNRQSTDPEWDVGRSYGDAGYTLTATAPTGFQASTPWVMSRPLPVEAMDYTLAQTVVADAGATMPERDNKDTEVVGSFTADFTGQPESWMVLNHTTLADYPTYTTPAAPTDTDGDAMPDTWETAKGLNPSVANSSAYTLSADYTDVEVYLNELAGDANNYYVNAATGSDGNDGTSPSAAWLTIAKVNSFNFAAGDVVRFASGDYGTTTLTPTTDHITFTSYAGAATKPILRGGVNMDGRSYVVIDGLDVTSTGITFSLAGATYNTIRNSNIYSTASSWSPTISVRNGSHFNKITGNTISQVAANNDIINLRNDADNNLIENNDIVIQGSHAAIDIEGWTLGGAAAVADRSGNNNIIRNNRITGHNGGGVHITIQANSFNNVIDGNVLKGDATVGNFCNLTYPATQYARSLALIKGVGEHNIIRNNVLSNYPCQDSEGLFFDTYTYDGFTNNALYNHIYHNVITGIGSGATGLYFGIADGGTHNNNYVKNNIFANNGGTLWVRDADGPVLDGGNPATGTVLFQMTDSLDSNYYDKNIFFTSATSGAVIWLGNNYYTVAQADASAKWGVNIQADPNLDANFLPQTGSPALNAGSDLTTITSASGSGTSFDVADAWYFTDGNGITGGDVIEVNGQTATITDITYGAGQTGTLTVTPAITWTQGMGVNLPFEGSAPPIGLSAATGGDGGGVITPPTTATRRIRGHFRAHLR